MATKALTRQKAASAEARKFIARVYAWMTLALFISGALAWVISNTESVLNIVWKNKYVFFALAILEIIFVFWFTAVIEKIKPVTAVIAFIFYSILNGVTLSAVFAIFKLNSIYLIFLVSALMFAVMSVYGMITKTHIHSFFRYLSMLMIGLFIAFLVNFFLKSDIFSWIISFVAVILFMFLTAYDTKKIVKASELADGSDIYKKASIYGALELYIDFIGIFLNLLKLFGREK